MSVLTDYVATGTETHSQGNTLWSAFTRGEQRSLDSLQPGGWWLALEES